MLTSSQDDRKSLAELHEYMNEDSPTETTGKRESYSTASILSTERRRSLPPRASVASLYSQYAFGDAPEQNSSFEVRRRRAAKLTQFFGVQYRDLFGEVLDSIESSVREDEGKGALDASEVEVCSKRFTVSFFDMLTRLFRIYWSNYPSSGPAKMNYYESTHDIPLSRSLHDAPQDE